MIGQVESTFSREIADASRRDGISMKTLAMLGATFLPGTFLSSLFSMSFFDFGRGKWLQTDKKLPPLSSPTKRNAGKG